MQEKCSFLLAHVEITAILAVFLDASGSNGIGLPKAVMVRKEDAVAGSFAG
jgi:hypothetical protein